MKQVLLISICSLLFFSCEKVIEVKLNESSPQLVVDAKLYEGTNDLIVNLNQTTDYYNPQPYQKVQDAVVTVADENGVVTTLSEIIPGNYKVSSFVGVPNKNYTLNITLASGEVYSSTAFLPSVVPLIEVIFDYEEKSLFGKEGYVPYCVFDEPANEVNYYRIIITVNGKRKDSAEDLFITDDALINGNEIIVPLFSERLELGDTVTMELITMDKNVYKYLETLSSISGGNEQQSAAPANPNTNIVGGALGYFGAYSISKLTKIIE